MRDLPTAVARFDSNVIREALDARGYWVSPPLLEETTCARIAQLYDAEDVPFRSTVTMARHGFGQGEYKYFGHPLPEIVTTLRRAVYERLAPVANHWSIRCGHEGDWPSRHEALVERCAAAGRKRPTPLLLRYSSGDYNCLPQDLYGEILFRLRRSFCLIRRRLTLTAGNWCLSSTALGASRKYLSCLSPRARWRLSRLRNAPSPARGVPLEVRFATESPRCAAAYVGPLDL